MNTGLTRDDIALLMEAYKNQMEVYVDLARSHESILNNQNTITDKQLSFLEKQEGQIKTMEKHMTNCSECKSIRQIDTVKILAQIRWAWVGMATIIISLIGLGWKIIDAIDSIEKTCGGVVP